MCPMHWQRRKLIDEVLSLFPGKMAEVLQKHDAARVIQSCFKQGDERQRDAIMDEIKGAPLAAVNLRALVWALFV